VSIKVVFFSFYYPPDLSAGSFRSISLAQELSKKLSSNDEIHIITTHPNRYASHNADVPDVEIDGKITIHRIDVPSHKGGMLSQMITFSVFSFSAFKLSKKLKPSFLIGTTSRLMTGLLTLISARSLGQRYFIDLRDIFSETISDLIGKKNKVIGALFKLFFTFLEKKVLNNASGVNIVSEGFREYFQDEGVNTSNWSFFPNGADRDFINLKLGTNERNSKVKMIFYAGNIGSGQGLETIIPKLAKILEADYRFVIVGDGSTLNLLRESIKRDNINNVELLPPVQRIKLVEYYKDADILFLHLNDFPAFKRVLPSKLFEYAALGKPIVAGLSGYPAEFLKTNLSYSFVFNPGNVHSAIACVSEASSCIPAQKTINNFVKLYSREVIMKKLCKKILKIIETE